jgi:ATP-dependent Lhr-like helicase
MRVRPFSLSESFHPAVTAWFSSAFTEPTPAQQQAWPLIQSGQLTLIAAPTGSGKTLTAFLAALDTLVCEAIKHNGALPDETTVVYISPLKALSNDIRINLERPLHGITDELTRLGLPAPGIRTAVRTGDTTQQERTAMRKRAPHILVTTPESLYVLLGSDSGRGMLKTTRTVIVDEIHAVAGSKRGSHLALSLERLDALCAAPPVRIGLSATQKPLDAVARFLVGADRPCAVVDIGHGRPRDLALELPPVPLEAVMANDVWERVYDRMAELAVLHRTTLLFVNTRRMAERTARHLADRLGPELVAAHHGSLAKETRLDAEQRLKRGELRVLIATASLELGIDIGDVDLVCQVGSPRSIAAFLQRVGRSGHHVGGTPKGRLFPTSRDDLIECTALLDCVRRGELDTLRIPQAPLDVLAQQIVAEVASREWAESDLYDTVRRAAPYAQLPRPSFDAVIRMLAEGYAGSNGVRGAYLHRDSVAGTVRARRGGKLTAVTSGGTIPDNADFAVLLEPQGLSIGTVNEDFAVESLAGDVFQLGNTSYRIVKVESGKVRVEDAHGAPPNIPFWLGEAPGRSDELSMGVGRLLAAIDRSLGLSNNRTDRAGQEAVPESAHQAGDDAATEAATEAAHKPMPAPNLDAAIDMLVDEVGISQAAATQIVDYLARARSALGALPSQDTLVMERFFDESGGMQLVIHSPFGSRVNRAWGLALRKRFCRTCNFELQAAATEDAIVLSLSTQHSFALDEVWRYLRSDSAEHVLIQALLDAPLFNVRWRWNATTALALPRFTGGRKVAPPLQRMRSDDLLTSVFPDQAACLENVVGEREIPSHPLVDQTLDDCLHDAMDSEAWLALLRRIEQGQVRLMARDLPAPSPLAMEILNAHPYAFLDDAPLEERRTQAVRNRRWTDPSSPDDLGALDAQAIADVLAEAWPQVRNADEMHEALMALGCMTQDEARRGSGGVDHDDRTALPASRLPIEATSGCDEGWTPWLHALAASGRALLVEPGPAAEASPSSAALWVPLERLPQFRLVYPDGNSPGAKNDEVLDEHTPEAAVTEIIRARLSGIGPVTPDALATPLSLDLHTVNAALARLEAQGAVLRGRFTPSALAEEWCDRHLLARIHRYTIRRLRRDIEPVERQDFMRFLMEWQHLTPDTRLQGPEAVSEAVAQLEGYDAAAAAWEGQLLPARVTDYSPSWLDDLCRAGKVVWTRLAGQSRATGGPVRGTPIVLLPRRHLATWTSLPTLAGEPEVSPRAGKVHAALVQHGAMFFDELVTEARLLPTELENALGELVSAGLVNADSFAGLRALLLPATQRISPGKRRGRGGFRPATINEAGRWAALRKPRPDQAAQHDVGPGSAPRRPRTDNATLEHIAQVLLRRYGVVFWRILEREPDWLPPWRDLLQVLHRMEARGEIRGGRFVGGLSGEQFALPEAIPLLRSIRKRPLDGTLVAVSATDPVNLVGTVLPGDKVPSLAANRLVFRDGLPVATLIGGDVTIMESVSAGDRPAIEAALQSRR